MRTFAINNSLYIYPFCGFIRALKPPGWKLNWHCGVRAKKNKKLLGFISGVPARIKIYDQYCPLVLSLKCIYCGGTFSVQVMVEINFLCVHKKLRSKRVAPVLIKEITRRVHMEGIFQAVYTAGVVLPKPVAVCRFLPAFSFLLL